MSLYVFAALGVVIFSTAVFAGTFAAMMVYYLAHSETFRAGLIDLIKLFEPPPELPARPILIQQIQPAPLDVGQSRPRPARVAVPLPPSRSPPTPQPSLRRSTIRQEPPPAPWRPPEHPPVARQPVPRPRRSPTLQPAPKRDSAPTDDRPTVRRDRAMQYSRVGDPPTPRTPHFEDVSAVDWEQWGDGPSIGSLDSGEWDEVDYENRPTSWK